MQLTSPLDRTFRALGDASRRQILETLSQRGACSAGTLVELFDTSQPTVSRHLRVLESAGLVARSIEGRRHFFRLKEQRLSEAEGWISRHVSLWQTSLDRLGEYLDDELEARAKDDEGA